METTPNKLLYITDNVAIHPDEIAFSAMRAQGPGGQNVNKVASAVHLRFDIHASTLPDSFKQRLLALSDHRITKDGVIVIKAQRSRSQDANKAQALLKLQALLQSVSLPPAIRRATKPTRGAQLRRVESKVKRGRDKALRGKIID